MKKKCLNSIENETEELWNNKSKRKKNKERNAILVVSGKRGQLNGVVLSGREE